MEIGTALGLVLALGAMLVALMMDGAHLSSLWAPSAFVLIFFGTIGMTMANFQFRKFARLPGLIARAFFPRLHRGRQLADQIVDLAEKARRDGLLSLQDDAARLTHPLLRRGVNLLIDGVDPEQVRQTLTTQVELEHHRQEALAGILEQAGGYSPTVGIIGTVMGLVHVLSNLQEVEKLGPLIAVAFLATFYGIFLANVFWLPLGGKLKDLAADEAEQGRMVLEAVLGLQTGQNPRALRDNLDVYLEGERAPAAPAKPAADREVEA